MRRISSILVIGLFISTAGYCGEIVIQGSKPGSPDIYIVPESHITASSSEQVRRTLAKLPTRIGAVGVENTLTTRDFLLLARGRPGARFQDLMPEVEARELWKKMKDSADAAGRTAPPFEAFYKIQPFFAIATFFSFLSVDIAENNLPQRMIGRSFSSTLIIDNPTLPVVTLDDNANIQNLMFHCSNEEAVRRLFTAADIAAKSHGFQKLQLVESRAALATGDLDRLLSSMAGSMNYEYAKIMYECNLTPRNMIWTKKMVSNSIAHGPVLYVVGAWHIYGDAGLMSLLSSQGYSFKEI